MGLDYVIASVYGTSPDQLMVDLGGVFPTLRLQACEPLRAYKGYSDAAGLFEGGDRAITVQWAHERAPLVIAPGSISGRVATHLQQHYEPQSSRKDGAVDFLDELAFDAIAQLAIRMANERGLK